MLSLVAAAMCAPWALLPVQLPDKPSYSFCYIWQGAWKAARRKVAPCVIALDLCSLATLPLEA